MILNKIKNKIIIAKIPYRSIAIWLFTVLLSSCLKETVKATEKEYQEAFLLWGNEQWKELNEYFIRHNLNDGWPPYNGFIESHKVPLKRGVILDRYDYNGQVLLMVFTEGDLHLLKRVMVLCFLLKVGP